MSSKPGAIVGELQKTRKRRGNLYSWCNLFVVGGLFTLLWIISQDESPSLGLLSWGYKGGFLVALFLTVSAGYWLRRANHAAKGARAEEEVGLMLKEFCEKWRWQMEAGCTLTQLRGDIDFVLISPTGLATCIDVKSSAIGSIKETLWQKMFKSCRHQAVTLRADRGIQSWVEAILCFTSHDFPTDNDWTERDGVYITSIDGLAKLLLFLDK